MSVTAAPEPIRSYAPTKPVEVQPNLRQVSRGYVTICSIYPAALTKRVNHNGVTYYKMQAAPRGSYCTLQVYDTQQWIKRPDPNTDSNNWEFHPMPIPAQIVGEDLVNTWGGDTLGARSGFKPGIALIAGDDPTPEELASMRKAQNALFNWFINDAQGLHVKGQTNEITDIHRLSAREMLDKGAERLPWIAPIDFAAVKGCPACGKQILDTALRCEHCTTMLPQFYMDFGIVPDNDAAVAAFIEKIKKQNPGVSAPVKTVSSSDPRNAGQPKQG